jgi:hypothetical protein
MAVSLAEKELYRDIMPSRRNCSQNGDAHGQEDDQNIRRVSKHRFKGTVS